MWVATGFNMIAGSILVFGSCGAGPVPACAGGPLELFGHGTNQALANLPCRRELPAAFLSDCSFANWLNSGSRSTRDCWPTICCSPMAIWSLLGKARSGRESH